MSIPLSDREVARIFEELGSLNAKLDSIQKTVLSDFTSRLAVVEQSSVGQEGRLKREVTRLDEQHRDMHQDLFGDKGLSARVRQTEHLLIHHGVVIAIVTAIAIVIGTLLVNHLGGELFRSASTAAATR